MKISTKLRLMTLKSGIGSAVAKIILDNVIYKDDATIARWMKDVVLNTCAYSGIKGLQYHNEIMDFYKANSTDVEMIIWDYEVTWGIPMGIIGSKEVAYSWYAFEEVVDYLMKSLHIR